MHSKFAFKFSRCIRASALLVNGSKMSHVDRKKMKRNSISFQADFLRVGGCTWIGGISLIFRSSCGPNVPCGCSNSNVFLNRFSFLKFAREMLRDFWSTDIDQVDASLDPKSLPVWRKRATFPAHDTKFVNRNEVISSI
jgi:hypothetical protein